MVVFRIAIRIVTIRSDIVAVRFVGTVDDGEIVLLVFSCGGNWWKWSTPAEASSVCVPKDTKHAGVVTFCCTTMLSFVKNVCVAVDVICFLSLHLQDLALVCVLVFLTFLLDCVVSSLLHERLLFIRFSLPDWVISVAGSFSSPFWLMIELTS